MKREEEKEKKLEVGSRKSEDRSRKSEAKAEAKSEESSCWHLSLVIAGVQSSEFKVQSLMKLNFSALSFAPEKSGQAVDFIQRIKNNTKREENIEYQILNIESGICANNMVSHSLPDSYRVLIPYFLFPNPLNAESRAQRAKGKEQGAKSREQVAMGKEQPATSNEQRATSNQQQVTREFSTVFHIKPSATETFCLTEGCISESRAVRACPSIRFFNN